MAERVTVEQNGERITLEVPDGTSDEQIQSFLSGGAPSSTPKQTTIGDVADKAFQTALPATYRPGPTGAAQLATELKEAQVFKPIVESAANRFSGYIAKPAKAIVDVGTMVATGMPGASPFALYETYKGAQEAIPKVKQALGSVGVDPTTFRTLADKLRPGDLKVLGEAVQSGGGKAALSSFELPAYLAKDADAVAALNSLKTAAGEAPGMVSRIASPALRAAGKVLGPAGLALNAYDAQQYAEASKLGERLGAGQGQFAQQAFRNQALNKPTPAPLQPAEAANLLASGDQRTIQIYGGQQHLEQIAGGKSPNAPPTSDNFIERIKAMAQQYGQITSGQ